LGSCGTAPGAPAEQAATIANRIAETTIDLGARELVIPRREQSGIDFDISNFS
jgi:hypothetical protein